MTSIAIALFFAVIVVVVLADNFSQPNQVKVEKKDTLTEDQKRWDRGNFTEEEIAEIKAEEAREDAEKDKFFEELGQ